MVVSIDVRIVRLSSGIGCPLHAADEMRETPRLCASKVSSGILVRIWDGRCLETVWRLYQLESLSTNRREIVSGAWQAYLECAVACIQPEVSRHEDLARTLA